MTTILLLSVLRNRTFVFGIYTVEYWNLRYSQDPTIHHHQAHDVLSATLLQSIVSPSLHQLPALKAPMILLPQQPRSCFSPVHLIRLFACGH